NAGSVSLITAIGSLLVNGDIVTSGTGSGRSGAITMMAPFVPTVEAPYQPQTQNGAMPNLIVGNLITRNIQLNGLTADGGDVIVLSGSSINVGNIDTSTSF